MLKRLIYYTKTKLVYGKYQVKHTYSKSLHCQITVSVVKELGAEIISIASTKVELSLNEVYRSKL